MRNIIDDPAKKKNAANIKIIASVIAVLLIISCTFIMYSCNNKKSTQIIKNGTPQYTIVTPDNCSDALSAQITDLISKIKTETGVELSCIKASEATDKNKAYVLIGSTGFEESNSAIEALGANADAYTIEPSGKHVVVTGHFDSATADAVKYLCEHLVSEGYNASSQTLTLTAYAFEGATALPKAFEASELSRYTVIYSDNTLGNQEVAEKIQKRIRDYTGITVNVGKDTETPETAYEIIVGKTNRHISQKYFEDKTYLMQYKLVVEKGQVQIVGGGPYSAKLGGYALASMLMDKNLSLTAGTHSEMDIATESIPITEGADVRIMTANLLTDEAVTEATRDNFPVPAERAEILAKILVDYTPDFVGVQEMSAGFVEPLNDLLKIVKDTYGLDYSVILTEWNGKSNHCPIIYRADKYRLDYQNLTPAYYLPNGTPPSKNWGNWYDNATAAAKFTSLTDPTVEIALLTSHWYWETEQEAANNGLIRQEIDARTMTDVFNYVKETFPHAKIFCTGDFNSHRFSGKYFNQFLSNISGAVASNIARSNGVLKESYKHQGVYIDHIIGKNATFDVLLHSGTKNASSTLTDHQPVFADIKFTK